MLGFAAAAGLALVHLVSGLLPSSEGRARHPWLSVAGGVSVAFVFVFLLPELAATHRVVERWTDGTFGRVGREAYLLALLGIVVFYGIDRLMILTRASRAPADGPSVRTALFWAHITSFTLYNGLIGYLIAHEGQPRTGSVPLFAIAIALHFMANDHAMRSHHRREYDRVGRWLLVPAPLVGWFIGTLVPAGDAVVAMLLAFLTGGIVLNVLKEELPEERESHFLPFALGALTYTALVLLL